MGYLILKNVLFSVAAFIAMYIICGNCVYLYMRIKDPKGYRQTVNQARPGVGRFLFSLWLYHSVVTKKWIAVVKNGFRKAE